MMRFFLLGIALTLFFNSQSQDKLFDNDDIIKIDIVANLREIFRDVNPETAKYHNALLSYIDHNGSSVNLNIKVKTRGIFRRSRDNCNIPPLSLKFSNIDLSGSVFDGVKKLKLVNVCNRKRLSFQQYLFKEHLVYKLYSVLTDYSFKVRLVKIVYIDVNNAIPPFESFGFFIEEIQSINKRTSTKELKTLGIVQEAVDRSKMDVTAFFQYMIGNTDWSVPKQHNIKLVISDSILIPIAIPYDFDFCGFVNPPYTKPPEIIPIKNVTDRYYRGFCRTSREIEPAINLFLEKRDTIYRLIINDSYLNDQHKKQIINYVDEFYKVLQNPKAVKREFIDNCRKE